MDIKPHRRRYDFNVLASSVVDCGFEPRSNQTKDYMIGICFFSAKHAAFVKKGQRHGWLGVGIRIICPSKATYVSANCCFNELTLLKFN